jgi:hypothetical protein
MMPSSMARTTPSIPDVTAAYRLWDQLFRAGLALASSTSAEGERRQEEARERLARGLARSLAERDAMWERIIRAVSGAHRGR